MIQLMSTASRVLVGCLAAGLNPRCLLLITLLFAPLACVVNPVPTPGSEQGGQMAADAGGRGDKDDNGTAGEADTSSPTVGVDDVGPPAADVKSAPDASAAGQDSGAGDVWLADDVSGTQDEDQWSSDGDAGP